MQLLSSCRWISFRGQCRHIHGASGAKNKLVPAEILEVKDLTPSIKELGLRVDGAPGSFSFKAGNWVDFFIDQDGVSKVGGYSMSSIPSDLPQLRLAVKASRHPPAQWCHTLAKPGKKVNLVPGGSFYFDANEHGKTLQNLVFIAGGIGINPIFSMLQEAYFHRQKLLQLQNITLLYSASKPSELAYMSELSSLADKWSEKLRLELRVTRDNTDWKGACGRLTVDQLRSKLPADRAGLLVYLCGPPGMTDQLTAELKRDGLGQALQYEKWW